MADINLEQLATFSNGMDASFAQEMTERIVGASGIHTSYNSVTGVTTINQESGSGGDNVVAGSGIVLSENGSDVTVNWSRRGSGYYEVRNNAAFSTSSSAFVDVTGMSIPLGTNERWAFNGDFAIGHFNTGGVQMSMAIPANATIGMRVQGSGNSATAMVYTHVGQSNGATSAMHTFNSNEGWCRISGEVATTDTAGSAQLRFKSNNFSQDSVIQPSGWIMAVKY